MIIPCKHSGYGEGGRLTATRRAYLDGGGGGGGNQTSTSYTTNVPEYAKQPFMEMIGKGIALSEAPYQAYGGERTAQFTPLQQQAFGQAETQQVAPQLGAATGLTGIAALQGLNAQFDPYATGQFTSQTAQQYMNPFMQNVVDIQKREAQRQSQIGQTQDQARAVQAGAFGGSRQAILQAERERNLAQQLGDIQATGSQAAFQAAQDQFNREQQMREQSRQFGAGFGMEGLRTALSGAGQLGQLGQQQFGQEMDIMGARQQMGTTQQQQIQRILDQQYADFQAQRDYPYQQLGFLSDLLRGTGSSTRQVYPTPQPTAIQQLAGLGTAAIGVMAKGGEVRYADGGITSLLGDQQLAQTVQNQEQSPMMQMAAAEEAQRRSMMRSAAPADMPQEADMTEAELLAALRVAIQQGDETKARVIAELIEERKMPESGIAQVAPESVGDVPEGGIVGMYDGGAVAFQEGGRTVRSPYTPRKTSGQRMTDDTLQALADAYENMPDALPIQLAREGTRQTVDALGNVVEAVADTKALPKSSGYLAQLERDEQAREARRAAARERELASKRVMTATPVAAAAPAAGIATLMPEIAPSAARDAKLLERQDPMSGGVALALAAKQAEDKAIADAGGNVATGGAQVGAGAITPAGYRAQLKAAGYDIDAQQAAEKKALEDEFAARREAVAADRADLERMIAERGVYGEEREKEAKAAIEGIKGEKDQARSMALFQAGLAILSADPSRGALAAIGEGALKGVGAYKGDLKELEAKRERMSDKLDRIVDIRRQERFADDDKRAALKKEENRLTADLARETRSTLQGFGQTNLSVAMAAVKASADSREKALDRQDRAQRLSQASRGDLAQLRISLDGEIARLERKDFRDADEEARLADAIAQRNEVRRLLGERSGMTGQAAPAANMTGWGKATVE
jgi:hypothetical protein